MTKLATQFEQIFREAPPYLCRKQVRKISGELVATSSLASFDCRGTGIPGKRLIGKKACYPKDEVRLWLLKYMGESAEA